MPPSKREAGPAPGTGFQQNGGGETDQSPVIVADHRGIGWHPGRETCPCGHDPAHDENCVRHRPVGPALDWDDAPIGVVDQGGLRVTSLREWRRAA